METKIVNLNFPEGKSESYDTQIPIDLFEAFTKLKDDLLVKSNGKYECTPVVFDPNKIGAAVCILEHKDGQVIKKDYLLQIIPINKQ